MAKYPHPLEIHRRAAVDINDAIDADAPKCRRAIIALNYRVAVRLNYAEQLRVSGRRFPFVGESGNDATCSSLAADAG